MGDFEGCGVIPAVLPVESLKPFPDNPRKHSERSIQGIAASIESFGFKNIVLVDKEHEVIYGHGRIEAAKRLGIKKIPVLIDQELSKDQAMALRITDNQVQTLSEWNELTLKQQVLKLKAMGMNLTVLGFSGRQLAKYTTDTDGQGSDPSAGELPKKPVAKKGDVWKLGDHRLMCGDSTDAKDVAGLLGDDKIDLCLTDPPYCVDYENIERRREDPTRKERGDAYQDPLDPQKLLKFIELLPCDILVMTFPINKHFHELSEATREWDLLYDCVWVKSNFAFIMSRRYQSKHEPILIFRRKKYKDSGTWNIPSNQSTVFEIAKPQANKDHPTIKPIELWNLLVQFHSNKGQTIYEPFCGSGTALISGEQFGRKVLAMELQPAYVDVAIRRWESVTGKKGVLDK